MDENTLEPADFAGDVELHAGGFYTDSGNGAGGCQA
jgi:hypothetical protein